MENHDQLSTHLPLTSNHQVNQFIGKPLGSTLCKILLLFFQPVFLTKEERAAQALKRRQEQVEEQKKKVEEERKKQMEFLMAGKDSKG